GARGRGSGGGRRVPVLRRGRVPVRRRWRPVPGGRPGRSLVGRRLVLGLGGTAVLSGWRLLVGHRVLRLLRLLRLRMRRRWHEAGEAADRPAGLGRYLGGTGGAGRAAGTLDDGVWWLWWGG